MKWFKIILIVFALGVAGYWVKCQMGINLIQDFAWEEHFTWLNALQKGERVVEPEVGQTVFVSTFDEILPRWVWGGIWSREAKAAKDDVLKVGRGSSYGLVITNASAKDWAFPSSLMVRVKPGEVLAFEGYARTQLEAKPQISFVLYDEAKKVIKWNHGTVNIVRPDWRIYAGRVVIPDGVSYVRLRLSGRGVGQSFFDDIRFYRVQ